MQPMKKFALFLLPLASACTTSLDTRPSYRVTGPDRALHGYEYKLPMLLYDITLTYKLTDCVVTAGGPSLGAPKFKIEGVAASDYVVGERYLMDYEGLRSDLKTTDFAVTTHDKLGTLKTLNVSVEDKTADVLKSAVEFGLKTAAIVAGVPTPPSLAGSQGAGESEVESLVKQETNRLLADLPNMKRPSCTPAAVARLAALRAAEGEVKRVTKLIADDTKLVEAITARASIRLTRTGDRKAMEKLQGNLIANGAELARHQKVVTDGQKELMFVRDLRWPLTPAEHEGELGLDEFLQAWLASLLQLEEAPFPDPVVVQQRYQNWRAPAALSSRPAVAKEVGDLVRVDMEEWQRQAAASLAKPEAAQFCSASGSLADCLKPTLTVKAELHTGEPRLALCPEAPETRCRMPADAGIAAWKDVPRKGVFYRQPERARLRLCEGPQRCFAPTRDILFKKEWDTAPQLGQLRFVPMKNKTFQNNTLSLELREDGSVVKLQYADKSARAAVAAAAAADIATKVDDARRKREDDRKKAEEDRKKAVSDARAEITYQRTEAAALRTEELAQIQYEFDLLTKSKALLDLRFPNPAVDPEYARETQRLQAIEAQLRARVAILEAQKKLGE